MSQADVRLLSIAFEPGMRLREKCENQLRGLLEPALVGGIFWPIEPKPMLTPVCRSRKKAIGDERSRRLFSMLGLREIESDHRRPGQLRQLDQEASTVFVELEIEIIDARFGLS
jgi:hypothetical protein